MNILPRPDIPGPIIRALTDSNYRDSLVDHFNDLPSEVREMKSLSVTTLPRSPRQRVLELRHSSEVSIDPVEEGFWKMFGTMIHLILEKYASNGDIVERRLGVTLDDGVYVHGQADRYAPKEGLLQDYKVTSADSFLYGQKDEHHFQLNSLKVIFEAHGHSIDKLENVYLFRDWKRSKVKEGSLYPASQIVTVNVPIWPKKKTIEEIKERVRLHMDAEKILKDDDLPFCSDTERWMGLPTYLVYKMDMKKNAEGVATPTRQQKSKYRSNSKLDATEWMQIPENAFAKKKVKGKITDDLDEESPISYELVEKKARPTKCGYCLFFQWCNQRKDEAALESPSPEEDED